jgi:antitoxin component YwqK of YwqJK toxin-antitoxin module
MRIDIDDTDLDEDAHYLYEGRPFTGTLVDTNDQGIVVGELTVTDGVPDGYQRGWYQDGRRHFDIPLVAGGPVGTSRRWYPNGRLAQEKQFTDDGDLIAIRRWAEDGTPLDPADPA